VTAAPATAALPLRARTSAWVANSPIALFLSVRLGYVLLAVGALLWAPPRSWEPRYPAWGGLSDLLFGSFAEWDANWWLGIVENGYTTKSAAFMPGYPGLVWLVGHVTASSLVAAVLVSVAAAAVGVHYVSAIASRLLGAEVARSTVLLVSLYPIAYVFTAAYSEGLFLAAAAAAVYLGMRERYWLAGLLAALAVSTRVLGLALVPALVVLAWPAVRRREFDKLVPVIALPLAAVAAVSVFFDRRLGDGLAFSHAQKNWDRAFSRTGPFGGAWDSLQAAGHGVGWIVGVSAPAGGLDRGTQIATWNVVDFLLLAAAVFLTVVVFQRLGLALGLYSAGYLAIAVSSPVSGNQEVLQSMARFLLCDFPLFIAGASLLAGSPRARSVVIISFAALGGAACLLFSRGAWVA
jgi:hypothetical protein